MKTLTLLQKKGEKAYVMQANGPFLKILGHIQAEMAKGAILIETRSVNPANKNSVNITSQVRKCIYGNNRSIH